MSDIKPCDLAAKSCKPCEGGVDPLSCEQAEQLLEQLDRWELTDALIEKQYEFKDHHQAMAFVNAVAWISHTENHHPEMVVGYNTVTVRYTTHAIGGLSDNDFICAAKVDALMP